jgi:hypothetical protein
MATATKTRSTRSLSKTRQVINYLSSGKTLSAAQANSKFGVKNLRAMISSIRERVEAHGNWEILTESNSRGDTLYRMVDIHPGTRTYGFDKNGNRYSL